MSFMTVSEMAVNPPHLLPQYPVLDAYGKALTMVPIFRFAANSFIQCGLVIVGQVLICSLAAFAFSFFQFPGRNFIFMAILSTMLIPGDAIIIANYLTILNMRLVDTYLGLVFPSLVSAMGIFLMRQFFLTIPRELHEAAILEGCGNIRFLFAIVMPISVSAIASLGIYIFINVFNSFMWPLLVTNRVTMRTVQIGLHMLNDSEQLDYAVPLAGSMMILIPSVVVFIIGQKYLVRGMTAGSIKG
jgi:sn-glycerol 3-phosphate transport system permease protein